jgi:hypothetical protein
MSKSRSNKKRREDQDVDDDDERVLFFIPSAGINIEVLVFYIKNYLGQDSDAEPGVHPRVRLSLQTWNSADHVQDRDIDGYFIKSRLSLNAVSLPPNVAISYSDESSKVMVADLKQDSDDWKEEKRRKRPRSM